MSRINEKLGIRPQTTRKATHGASLVTNAVCEKCGGRHVIENAIHGVVTRLCCFCGWLWEPEVVHAG